MYMHVYAHANAHSLIHLYMVDLWRLIILISEITYMYLFMCNKFYTLLVQFMYSCVVLVVFEIEIVSPCHGVGYIQMYFSVVALLFTYMYMSLRACSPCMVM